MGQRPLVLALAGLGLLVGAVAAIGVVSIVHSRHATLGVLHTSSARPAAAETPAAISSAMASPVIPVQASTSPIIPVHASILPVIPADQNGPLAETGTSLGVGVHGNALLVSQDSHARFQTWYWDGTSWRPAPTSTPGFPNSVPVFDPVLHESVFMTGGSMGSALQTWAWDGSSWTDLKASPPGVTGPSTLVFDTATRQLIMSVGSTWLLHGAVWQQAAQGSTSPEARYDAGAAYDPQHDQVVLFGGYPNTGVTTGLTDTWTWDGSGWTLQHPVTSPKGGSDSLAYDPDLQELVLLEEDPAKPGVIPTMSMWTWNGSNWVQLHPAAMPTGGSYAGLVYDSANHELVLFESDTSRINFASQTWTYRGGTWRRAA